MTRKQYLALPHRQWDATSTYDYLDIVPTYERHKDSKFRLMAIVGCRHKVGPVEIAATSDVIDWRRSPATACAVVMNEMDPSTNILSVWSHICKFQVGPSLSTATITIV